MVGNEVVALLRHRRVQLFSEIANALPHYTWQALFTALQQLSRERRIEFVRYGSDFEVMYESVYSTSGKAGGPFAPDEEHAQSTRTTRERPDLSRR
jgi:hypothetical protein